MSPSSGIIFRSKLSASFTNSSIATYRTTAARYASRFRDAPKTHSQEPLTTVSSPTQDNKQCEHTAPKLLRQTTPVPADCNPFIFSRGHWLSHDSARQAARQIHFDFPELCKRVVACCPGANSIASWSKQDGHISRTLIFHTDNGKRLVVRLPTPAAGPAGRNFNSEVATIKYLSFRTDIPVPQILEWREDTKNTVGHPYLIVGHASGVPLHQIWQDLGKVQKIKYLKSVARQLAKSSELCFPAYGSLYLSNTNSLPASRKIHLGHNFCIGPQCGPNEQDLYSCNACIPDGGPWLNMVEFAGGVIHLGLSNVANKNNFWISKCSWQGAPEEHASLLNHAHHVLRILANDPRINSISTPTMMPCATLEHVFVKPGEPETITCMTGWRACPISPLFLFCVNRTLNIPNPYLTSGKTRFEADLILYFDDVERANASFPRRYIPRLSPFPPRVDRFGSDPTHDHSPDYEQLYGLFCYCHRTCADGIPVLQSGLQEIAELWRPLQLPGSCPYEPLTGKDLQRYEQHLKQSEEWDMEGRDVNFEVGVDEIDHELILNDFWPGVRNLIQEVQVCRPFTCFSDTDLSFLPQSC